VWGKKTREAWNFDFFKIDGRTEVVGAYSQAADGGGMERYLQTAASTAAPDVRETQPLATTSTYQGWKSLCLGNNLIELQVLPDIGGRIIQFKLGGHAFLWVNPLLAGKLPAASGLTEDGGWFNSGGDKLWPAPQGWANEQQWPGPPDAVLDGQPYQLEKLPDRPGETAIRLTSRNDPRSGIRLSRVVRIFANSTRVSFEATMENIDSKPRRWGIWAHTQLDGALSHDNDSFPARKLIT